MAIMADANGEIAVLTLACPAGTFPSVGALHPPAIRLERAIRSLYGFEAVGAVDRRPWLDLGFWSAAYPQGCGPFDRRDCQSDRPAEVDGLARTLAQQAAERALLAAPRRRSLSIAQAA
jgi:Ni,Fe-hydrogenase III component G